MADKQESLPEQDTASVNPSTSTQDAELDELLNSALDDFDKPPPHRPAPVQKSGSESDVLNAPGGLDGEWTEEFIKQAAAQFEQNMQSLLSQSGLNLEGAEGVSPDQLGANFQKIAEAAAKAISEDSGDADFSAAITQTLKNLSEGAENLQNPFSEEELMKMMGGLGVNDGTGAGDGSDLLPFMQQMMQSLLSKEILYPALKEIFDKYPEWLEKNKDQLDPAELERYSKQKTLMGQVCSELEKESDSDSPEVKKQRFNSILELMQKMQDCGHPPKELVSELGPIMTFDEEGNPQLPGLPVGADPNQCTVM
ncbi:peroxisomal biogenesis factor 19 [Anabrus simplex]|uniref:peroxisomal biogenesis factor 19 n=1 Tax=Anabrus simplex TaxID=316456 RepID=UPI0035A3AB50